MSGIEIELAPSADTNSSCNGRRQADGSGGSNLAVPVDGRVAELSQIIVDEMLASQVPAPPRPQIYRVPEVFLAADKGAYQPRFLSLGPYYRGVYSEATDEMRRNDEKKPGNLVCALGRDGGGPSVEEYMKLIASVEAEARSRYDRDVTMDMEWGAFCRMLLLDGFQLISLLECFGYEPPTAAAATAPAGANQASAAGTGSGTNQVSAAAAPGRNNNRSNNQEPCTPRTGALSSAGHDLMMLENQIPFFVVQKIYGLRYGHGGGRKTVAELAWRTIRSIMHGVPAASSHPPETPEEWQHLVHMCHVYLKPSCLQESLSVISSPEQNCRGASYYEYGRFRRATEYYEAGVKFRRLCNENGSARPLLDVTFCSGVLKMAHHKVDEKTNYILRNVLAYEQRYLRTVMSGATGYVTAYVVFMSQLLGGPEDVALLSRRGVIEHHLGNDAQVCALFRGLAQGLVFDPSSNHYLNLVGTKLRSHSRSRINRWRAWVVRHRFGNPWLAAAWFFGAMAVLGTIVQTVVALLQYLNQIQGPAHSV
uniref:Uncharacterized protein n=1 Tax=Avena sativa TaxID=4498 RepID=A0ACD6AFB4_AVESA